MVASLDEDVFPWPEFDAASSILERIQPIGLTATSSSAAQTPAKAKENTGEPKTSIATATATTPIPASAFSSAPSSSSSSHPSIPTSKDVVELDSSSNTTTITTTSTTVPARSTAAAVGPGLPHDTLLLLPDQLTRPIASQNGLTGDDGKTPTVPPNYLNKWHTTSGDQPFVPKPITSGVGPRFASADVTLLLDHHDARTDELDASTTPHHHHHHHQGDAPDAKNRPKRTLDDLLFGDPSSLAEDLPSSDQNKATKHANNGHHDPHASRNAATDKHQHDADANRKPQPGATGFDKAAGARLQHSSDDEEGMEDLFSGNSILEKTPPSTLLHAFTSDTHPPNTAQRAPTATTTSSASSSSSQHERMRPPGTASSSHAALGAQAPPRKEPTAKNSAIPRYNFATPVAALGNDDEGVSFTLSSKARTTTTTAARHPPSTAPPPHHQQKQQQQKQQQGSTPKTTSTSSTSTAGPTTGGTRGSGQRPPPPSSSAGQTKMVTRVITSEMANGAPRTVISISPATGRRREEPRAQAPHPSVDRHASSDGRSTKVPSLQYGDAPRNAAPASKRVMHVPRGYRHLHGGIWSDAGVRHFEAFSEESRQKDPAEFDMYVHDHFRQYGVHETIIRALQRLHYLLGERPQEKETFGFFEGVVLYMFHACRDMFSVDERKQIRVLVRLAASLFVKYFEILERSEKLTSEFVPNMNHVWEMLCSLGDYWNDLGEFLTGFPDYLRCLLCRYGLQYKCDFPGSHTRLTTDHCEMLESIASEDRQQILPYLVNEDDEADDSDGADVVQREESWEFHFEEQWAYFIATHDPWVDLVTGLPYDLNRWSGRQRSKFQASAGYNRFDEDDYL